MRRRFEFQYECAKICLIYLVLGFLWIYFSDKMAYHLTQSKGAFLLVNNYKGWIYVIITAAILYFLISDLLVKVEQSKKEILYLSYHDVLTGIFNRRYFEMEITRIDTEKNLPISVIMADVNGLKMINDAFGHQMGDELLKKSVEAMKNSCRSEDVIVRWGGDEFVILLPNTDSQEAKELVNRIRDNCSKESFEMLELSLALGWDTKTHLEVDLQVILKNAEDFMYQHKIVQTEDLRSALIKTIVNTLYEKNPREEKHSERVGEVSMKIGKAMGFSEMELSKIKAMGHLHDIGKIGIEEDILNKTGRLTSGEREKINRHPDIGYRILNASNQMIEIAECVLAHHERWDGNGYPRGLSGDKIPLSARIVALADSFDAMSSVRPYRSALSEEKILQEIKKNAGYQFDPEIARIFIEEVLKKPWDSIEI